MNHFALVILLKMYAYSFFIISSVIASSVMLNPIFAKESTCVNATPIYLKYEIKGGMIKSICLSYSWALIVTFDANSDGQMIIKIPRNILDAKLDNCDDVSFEVLVDGAENDYTEEKSFLTRTMTIPFEGGSSELEIIAPNTIEYSSFLGCLEDSPKQQIMAGTPPQDVVCNHSFVLIRKISNDSVACVTPPTFEKLVERGWGRSI